MNISLASVLILMRLVCMSYCICCNIFLMAINVFKSIFWLNRTESRLNNTDHPSVHIFQRLLWSCWVSFIYLFYFYIIYVFIFIFLFSYLFFFMKFYIQLSGVGVRYIVNLLKWSPISKTCLQFWPPLNPALYSKTCVYRGIHYFPYFCSKA